ncbi:hypothetical protein L9F63_024462 [Diploptera punctata]|uniref:Uncharacterized protein n=1 Tax=Diploptera punctata TaxID=6984 RepID=A0AAD7ZF54_DIPPU|nr:hypothetical protein L9F63_024462 [Diploptera punctata]
MSALGRYQDLKQNDNLTLQFMSCSEDGTLCIWDILSKSRVKFGRKKTSQNRKFPLLKPLYKLIAENPESNRRVPVTSLTLQPFPISYIPQDKHESNILGIDAKLIYKPEFHKPKEHPKCRIYIGSMDGEVMQATWSGHEFNPGESINSEIWDFLIRSDQAIMVQSISGGLLTGIYPSRFGLTQNLIGVADNRGIFHVFFIPHEHVTEDPKQRKLVTSFFQ